MPHPTVSVPSPKALRELLQDEIAGNPFLTAASTLMRIADRSEVRVPAAQHETQGTVVEYRGGDYAVRLPDGRTPTFDGATLERLNPDAPRVSV